MYHFSQITAKMNGCCIITCSAASELKSFPSYHPSSYQFNLLYSFVGLYLLVILLFAQLFFPIQKIIDHVLSQGA
jgi:hypothetical protein